MKNPAEAGPEQALPARTTADEGAVKPAEPLSARQLALTELRAHLSDWMTHEPGARRGSDAEELHQLRVAARRIEATLGLFRHQLPAALVHARSAAKGVLRGLGAARDFDVQLAELRRYCADLPGEERKAAAPLKARLEEGRAQARMRMLAMLDSEATRHWLETLNLASADFAAAVPPGAPQAALVMPERVRRRFRKLKKAVRRLDGKSAMRDHHTVRRRAKQLRYAIECGATLFGKPAEEMLKSLRRLQDRLGAHQDADMAKNRLAELAASGAPLPPQTLFLMGRLAEHHLTETQQARKTLEHSWARVGGKRWKALRNRMEDLRRGTELLSEVPQPAAAPAALLQPQESDAPDAASPEAAGPRPLRH
jgi:CHAD domain-containing protein